MADEPLLDVNDIHTSYGESHVLFGVSLSVNEGEVVSLLGRNGAGKTTTLRSIAGILPVDSGQITFQGENITNLQDYTIADRGISYVPENRQIFPDFTVEENLKMGKIHTTSENYTMEEVFDEFPRLRNRRSQRASQLSGGEQQMLVIARALLSDTKLLMLDEPTEGLAPKIVNDVIRIISEIKDRGITVLLVEQNVNAAVSVADRHYIIDKGEVVYEGSNQDMKENTELQEEYLGVGIDIKKI